MPNIFMSLGLVNAGAFSAWNILKFFVVVAHLDLFNLRFWAQLKCYTGPWAE